ncbi:MAG: branched-chain amino acid ABC transporter substrate-binding protein [Anaerolineae bacterium]|nr:branched-chain amino acid ABC transporter substrate-binding protein [Anaerolineae bacterium]
MRALIAFSICVVLVVSACTPAAQPAQPATPSKGDVIVFVAVPLSGFMANGGQTILGGVRLAAHEINQSGGLLGYNVVVEGIDDEADSGLAAENAQAIAERVAGGERVLGVIGHLNSGQTEAALPIYDGLDIVVITPTSSLQSLTAQGYRRFFRVNASDATQAAVDARFLVEKLGATRIAVLHNDEQYGIDLAAGVQAELEALGADVATVRQIPIGPPDPVNEPGAGQPVYYPEALAEIQASGADAVFYAGYEIECPYLRYDLREVGLEGLPFLASDGCFLAATIDESDGAAAGMYVSAFGPSPEGDTVGQNWVAGYQAVEYRNPDTYSINGYVAMRVLIEGVQKANSLEANAVADAIRDLDMETFIGQIQYEDTGDLKDPAIFIYKVEEDEFRQVYPE